MSKNRSFRIADELTWQEIENTVANRMVDSSMIHSLKPQRKICKRTRVLNGMLKNHACLKSYSEYVKIKTAILRNMLEDDETDNAANFSDEDYSAFYKTRLPTLNVSSKKVLEPAGPSIERQIRLNRRQTKKSSNENKKKRISPRTVKRKEIPERKKSSFPRINVGWQQVVKRKTEVQNLSQESINRTASLQHDDTIDKEEDKSEILQESSSFKISVDVHCNGDDDEKDTIELTQNMTKLEIENRTCVNETESQQVDDSSIKIHTRELDTENTVIINETTDKEQTELSLKGPKTPENVKKNLTAILSNVTQDLNKDANESQDSDRTNNLNWSDLTFSNVRLVGQSTPVSKESNNVPVEHKLHTRTKSSAHPKDSGIDEDSQEDSLSDSNGKATRKDRLHILERKNNLNLEVIREQETIGEVKKQYIESNSGDSSSEESASIFNGTSNRKEESDNEKISASDESISDQKEENLSETENNSYSEVEEEQSQKSKDNVAISDEKKDSLSEIENNSNSEAEEDQSQKSKNGADEMNTENEESDSCMETKEKQEQEISLNDTNIKENDHDSHHSQMEGEQKQKLPPKVMHTEIVNKKYKIVHDEHHEEHSNVSPKKFSSPSKDISQTSDSIESKNVNDNEVDSNDEFSMLDKTSEKHSEISMENLHLSNSSEDEKNTENIPVNSDDTTLPIVHDRNQEKNINTYEESDGEDMSPSAAKRLQQLKRLNLLDDSESSEDEVPPSQVNGNDRKSIFDRVIKAKDNDKFNVKIENGIQKDINQNKTFHKKKSNCENDDESEKKLNCPDTNTTNLSQDKTHNTPKNDTTEEKIAEKSPKRSRLSLKRNPPYGSEIDDTTITEQSEEKMDCKVDISNNTKQSPCHSNDRNNTTSDLQDENESSFPKIKTKTSSKVISNEAESLRYVLRTLNKKKRKNKDNELQQLNLSGTSSHPKVSTVNTDERPQTLHDLIDYRELTAEECASRFSLKDFSEDDEVLFLTVPTTIDLEKLKNQKIKLKDDKIRLGKRNYKILNRPSDTISCIFRSGKRHKAFKTVNIKPVRSVVVQGRLRKDSASNSNTKEFKTETTHREVDNNISLKAETSQKKIKPNESAKSATNTFTQTEDKYIFWKKKRLKRDFAQTYTTDLPETDTSPREKKRKSKCTENVEET